MDEVMMVPVQEFKRLQEYYKGQMTENALLNKAGRLAAEEHLILKDKRIPDSMAVKMTKPLSSEQGRLIKRIRTGKTGPMTFQGTEEDRRDGRCTRGKTAKRNHQERTPSPCHHSTRTLRYQKREKNAQTLHVRY